MVVSLALVRTDRNGQVIVEAALVLPILVMILLGLLQISLLAYGSMMARYAAFASLRACAVSSPLERGATARAAAAGILSGVPGVRLLMVLIREQPMPLRGAALLTNRVSCKVTVMVPHILPFPGLRTLTASAAMPMEPVR